MMGRKAEKAKPPLRETKRQTEKRPHLGQYNQEEVHRLLGDQRTGVSIPATLAFRGSAGIFWE
jgi:hypothetical protein